jgi:isocitrate dehydrogenase (NAD+)
VPGPEIAVSCRIITRKAAQRIVTAAFEYAKKRGFKGVTICEKPNVVRETSGMMEEVAKEVAKNYPGIALWSTNIDAQLMWLNKNPEEYNVIVASNLFGDILSDAFAGWSADWDSRRPATSEMTSPCSSRRTDRRRSMPS